ncbi:MAG: hypothetical protein Q8M76_05060, partial [Spirochaetaceae bacterium]|nr:hypothetical protein [Spirochaetaceae bacterium]
SDEGVAWASARAEEGVAVPYSLGRELRWLVFFALVRGKAPIEPRWYALLPLSSGDFCLASTILAGPRQLFLQVGAMGRSALAATARRFFGVGFVGSRMNILGLDYRVIVVG